MSYVSKAQKVRHSIGHAFSFAYVYPTAAVVWVERPEDVPPWDWTRCDAMKGPRAPWGTKQGGLLLYAARREPNPYADAHALPVPAMSYPRIVRQDTGQHASKLAPRVHSEFLRLWQVAENYHYSPFGEQGESVSAQQREGERRFRDAATGVALRAGILSPYGTADSIYDWWIAALEVAVWVDVLNTFEMTESAVIPEDFWSGIEIYWGVAGPYAPEGTRLKKIYSLLKAAQVESRKNADVNGLVKKQDARSAIAQFCLFPLFMRTALMHSTPQAERGGGLPTVLRASVGALDWAHYELAQLYGAVQTRTCASLSCGGVFVPRRSNERFCSSTCKVREQKARQRAAARAASPVTTVSLPQEEAEGNRAPN